MLEALHFVRLEEGIDLWVHDRDPGYSPLTFTPWTEPAQVAQIHESVRLVGMCMRDFFDSLGRLYDVTTRREAIEELIEW